MFWCGSLTSISFCGYTCFIGCSVTTDVLIDIFALELCHYFSVFSEVVREYWCAELYVHTSWLMCVFNMNINSHMSRITLIKLLLNKITSCCLILLILLVHTVWNTVWNDVSPFEYFIHSLHYLHESPTNYIKEFKISSSELMWHQFI